MTCIASTSYIVHAQPERQVPSRRMTITYFHRQQSEIKYYKQIQSQEMWVYDIQGQPRLLHKRFHSNAYLEHNRSNNGFP